jgi:hypothetical protein
MRRPRASAAGSGRQRAVARIGLASITALAAVACASGDASSFTSLASADAQARDWVDTAVTGAIPGASTADGHAEGPDSCTTSADFSEMSYSLSADVPAAEVDTAVALVWQGFRDQGFGTTTAGTTPVAPGSGSPSWTVTLVHDGFRVEITGARTEPTYVSTYIVTPCLKTS